MEKVQILIVGNDPVVIQKLLRFVNENPEWEGTGTIDNKTAMTLSTEVTFDYVVLVDFFSEASVEMLHDQFRASNPGVIFLRHYGDSTGLLASELYDLMDKHSIKSQKDGVL